jgi:hypothetical protein
MADKWDDDTRAVDAALDAMIAASGGVMQIDFFGPRQLIELSRSIQSGDKRHLTVALAVFRTLKNVMTAERPSDGPQCLLCDARLWSHNPPKGIAIAQPAIPRPDQAIASLICQPCHDRHVREDDLIAAMFDGYRKLFPSARRIVVHEQAGRA